MEAHPALLIGNFDGVHLGHAAIVERAREVVSPDGRVIALSFDPHPMTVLKPAAAPERLTSRLRRQDLLLSAGCDEVHFMEPTPERLAQEPDEFINWITKTFHPRWIVEGTDFCFGRGRTGTLDTLRSHGAGAGYEVIEVQQVEVDLSDGRRGAVRSGTIRECLRMGHLEDASIMLGRSYDLCGSVVVGDRRGRDLGIPTANLDHGDLLLPADGIYAGTACDPDGVVHRAAISVGTKPTFQETPRVCEVHLLEYEGPLDHYGWKMTVRFDLWLRDQVAFSGTDALIEQLHHDLDETRRRVELPSVSG